MKKKIMTIVMMTMMVMMIGCKKEDTTSDLSPTPTMIPETITQPVIQTYQVVFNLNGGELVSGSLEQTVLEGSAAVAPNVKNGTKQLSWDKDFSNITGNTIVSAVWTANTYTVTFEPNMEGLSSVSVEVEEGSAATAPVFQVSGWEQDGWDKDFNSVTQNMTVTAKWKKKAMTGTEISDYAESRIVTVYTHNVYGNEGSGSGFFIDDKGTLVTNYHVVQFADKISVAFSDGGTYAVESVIDFEEKYDIAILKVDIEGNDYFEFASTHTKGEQVYAIGSALGNLTSTMTSGIISNASRKLGLIDCIQMDAAISHGNSGGPLINVYGEVIGINSFSFASGNELNLAIAISMLDKMSMNRNFSVNDYVEWWRTEISRSYRPTNIEDTGYYQYSLINTYHNYTNTPCKISMDAFEPDQVTDYAEGYDDRFWVFMYDYSQSSYEQYVSYLKSLGFEYQLDLSGEDKGGTLSVYYSTTSDQYVYLYVTNEKGAWEGVYLQIATVY